jgi:hypothetical protein
MQDTTGHLKPVTLQEFVSSIKADGRLIIAVLVLLFAVAHFSDSIHQALDPAYKSLRMEEDKKQRDFDNDLRRFD